MKLVDLSGTKGGMSRR